MSIRLEYLSRQLDGWTFATVGESVQASVSEHQVKLLVRATQVSESVRDPQELQGTILA